MSDLKYIVSYQTWVDYEGHSDKYLGVFDTIQDAVYFMQRYSEFHKLGEVKSSTFFNGDYFNLPEETLAEEDYSDGHCFRVYTCLSNPEVPY